MIGSKYQETLEDLRMRVPMSAKGWGPNICYFCLEHIEEEKSLMWIVQSAKFYAHNDCYERNPDHPI